MLLSTLLTIYRNTPGWAWAVLAALIVLGVRQSVARRLRPARVTALPLAFVALSLAGAASAFGPRSLTAWALGLSAQAALVAWRGAPAGARWLAADRAFELPGSWLPLALLLGIFALRFAIAVLLARQPALRGDAAFASLAGAAYGVSSGIFVGRAMALWRLALPGAGPSAATIAR